MDDVADSRTRPSLSRRQLLKWACGALVTASGLTLAVPMVDSLLGPAFRQLAEAPWSKVTSIDMLPLNQPVNVTFTDQSNDAYIQQTAQHHAWAVKFPDKVVLYSPICTHLGCRYGWNADAKQFQCPCHGSIFALNGKVLGGPAPRPLDTLPIKEDSGELFARWELFKTGIPVKEPV